MKLEEKITKQGQSLFKHRSYVPLVMVVVSWACVSRFHYFMGSPSLDSHWETFCLLTGLLGLGIRSLTIGYAAQGTSGRNCSHQVADALNTRGLYSLCRNPLYLGNFFMWLSVAMLMRSLAAAVTFLMMFTLLYERIIAEEERFLSNKFGAVFDQWTKSTPIFFPRSLHWKSPVGKFVWPDVVRREYLGLTALLVIQASFAAYIDFTEGKAIFPMHLIWRILLPICGVVFIAFYIPAISRKLSLRFKHAFSR
jgi:protein-S-isoprenylcysteine O-methyltransferase Ste14